MIYIMEKKSILLIILLLTCFAHCSTKKKVKLYNEKLSQQDFQHVQKELKKMKIPFSTDSDHFIFLANEEITRKMRVKLWMENKLKDLSGYSHFNLQKMNLPAYLRNINIRRTVNAGISRHFETLEGIERARVIISANEYDDATLKGGSYPVADPPFTVLLEIIPSPDSDIYENNKKIKQLRNYICKIFRRLRPEYVFIIDHKGKMLTDQLETLEGYQEDIEFFCIKEEARWRYYNEIHNLFSPFFSKDKYEVIINIEIDTIKVKNENHSQTKLSQKLRDSKTPVFGHTGLPGKYTTHCCTMDHSLKNQYIVKYLDIALFIDEDFDFKKKENGKPMLVNDQVVPVYKPIDKKKLKKVEELLQVSFAYSPVRKDTVQVKAVRFDRSKEFQKISNELRK